MVWTVNDPERMMEVSKVVILVCARINSFSFTGCQMGGRHYYNRCYKDMAGSPSRPVP